MPNIQETQDAQDEDLNSFICKEEDIAEVVDDLTHEQPMSEDDDDMDEALQEQIVFEDDSVQGFFQHQEPVYCLACHPTHSKFVVSGGGDDACHLWDLETGKLVKTLAKYEDSVSCIEFSKNLQWIASGGLDGKVYVMETQAGDILHCLEGPSDISCLDWHPSMNLLLAAGGDGTIWLWELPNGNCLNVLTGHLDQVNQAKFTVDGESILSISNDGSLIQWNVKTGAQQMKLSSKDARFHQDAVTALALDITGQCCITGAQDGTLRLIQLRQFKILSTFEDHEASIEAVTFSNSSQFPFICSSSVDGAICVWNQSNGALRCKMKQEDAVTKLLWQPASPFFFSSSMDQTLCKWDARTGQCIKVYKGHQEGILDFALSADSKYLVTAGDDGVCLVFQNEPSAQ